MSDYGSGVRAVFALLAVSAFLAGAAGETRAEENPLEALGAAFQAAAAKAAPAVVQVVCDHIADVDGPGEIRKKYPNPVSREIGKKYQENRLRFVRPQGPASGVVVDGDGYVLTSLYNIAGKIENLRVVTPDGRSFPAKVQGQDPNKDIVLLKIKAKGLPALEISRDIKPVPGQFSLTLGRGADPSVLTVNSGIVSAVHRSRGDAIQTSARVNYGNCGGALVDLSGNLLGIITWVGHDYLRNRSGINTGVGFAASSSVIAKVIDRLKQGKKFPKRPKPFLGIRFDPSFPADQKGVRIEYVYRGKPSETAGLKPLDVLVNFEYVDIDHRGHLAWVIEQCDPGQRVTFSVLRGEEALDLEGVLTKRPGPAESLRMAREYLEDKTPRALGIRVDVDYNSPGVFVRFVHEGFPLAEGGVRAGDVILGAFGLNNEYLRGWFPSHTLQYFDRPLPYCFEGAQVTFRVWREGKERMIPVIVGRHRKEEDMAALDRAFEEAKARGTLPSPPGADKRTAIARDFVRWRLLLHLGIRLGDLTEEGWEVAFAHRGFPGHDMGLKKGDVLVSLRALRVQRGPRSYSIRMKPIRASALPKKLPFLAGDIPERSTEGTKRSSHWLAGDLWNLEYSREGVKKDAEIRLKEYPSPAALLAMEGEFRKDFRLTVRHVKGLKAVLVNRSSTGRYQALRALSDEVNWDVSIAGSFVEILNGGDKTFLSEVHKALKAHPSRSTLELLIRALPVKSEDVELERWQDKGKLEIIKSYLEKAELPGPVPDFGVNGKLWQRWWKENQDRVRFRR